MEDNNENNDILIVNGREHKINDDVSFVFRTMQEDILHQKSKNFKLNLINKIFYAVVLIMACFIVYLIR